MSLRMEIKARGMTINGALIEGWKALEERKEWRTEIETRDRSLDRAKATIADLRQRVSKLEDGDSYGKHVP